MSDIKELVWPFPVPPVETLSERERARIAFLECAFAEGFSPRVEHHFAYYTAQAGNGRSATIIRRVHSRDWWEVILSAPGHDRVASGFVTGFDVIADLVLRWLRGENEAVLWEALSEVATRRWRNDEYIDSENPTRGWAGQA